MESQPQNPEFMINPENFDPWVCFSIIDLLTFHLLKTFVCITKPLLLV